MIILQVTVVVNIWNIDAKGLLGPNHVILWQFQIPFLICWLVLCCYNRLGSPQLLWRHIELDGVSNHQSHDYLLNRLFRGISKKTPKLRVTGLCARNSLVTGESPAQRASNAENVSIWRRHDDNIHCQVKLSDIAFILKDRFKVHFNWAINEIAPSDYGINIYIFHWICHKQKYFLLKDLVAYNQSKF